MAINNDVISRTLSTPYGTAAQDIVAALVHADFDAWWVGGGVRDMLLGHIPEDIDIATDATPQQMKTVFKRIQDDDAAFGSMRVRRGEFEFEVTTFRQDDEVSDGRHPESVAFGTREQDAVRRDFTINALYWHPITRELYDPFGGEADLREHLIRFIGDPTTRIKHDALRIFRAVRFRARLDGQYHPETYTALREQASLIDILSGQRKLEELEKLLASPHPDRGLEDLWELRILERFLPELFACKGIAQPEKYHQEGDVWDHMLRITQFFQEDDSPDVRLAALFHDSGKVQTFSLQERIRFDTHASLSADLADTALERLQCPRKRRQKIDWLIRHHMMMGTFLEVDDKRKAHWYFHEWFPELLCIFRLDIEGTEPADFSLYDRIVEDYEHFLDAHPRPPKPLLDGEEIMRLLSLKPGKKIGELTKALHEEQIHGRITTRREAEEFLRSLNATSKNVEEQIVPRLENRFF